jgi:hypothetical protein
LALVGCDDHTGRGNDGVHQSEVGLGAGRKQAASRTEHERVVHQEVLVDQTCAHQRSDQLAAAEDRQAAALVLPDAAHRFNGFTA